VGVVMAPERTGELYLVSDSNHTKHYWNEILALHHVVSIPGSIVSV
jgi:hypothetical protein